MVYLRPLLAYNSEQYFTSPASYDLSETINELARKAALTRKPDIELGLIQTQMAQKPMLRAEVHSGR
jgi:hypothetical protein